MTVLFVIATIILFLVADFVVRRLKDRSVIHAASLVHFAAQRANPVRIPEGIFFSPSHTWLNLLPSGKLYVGIDDFVTRLLEDPEIVLLKKQGERVLKGDPILLVREDGRELKVRAPMDGEILSVNDEVTAKPELIKNLLFTEGWAYTMKPNRLSELKNMLFGEETSSWIAAEFRRLREVFAGVAQNDELVPALLQDGGPPVSGAMKRMPVSVWNRFDQEFLADTQSRRMKP